jgi:hypothetical protein
MFLSLYQQMIRVDISVANCSIRAAKRTGDQYQNKGSSLMPLE